VIELAKKPDVSPADGTTPDSDQITARAGGVPRSDSEWPSRTPGAGFGLLAVVVHDIPIGILVVDASLRVVFANPAGHAILEQDDGIGLVGGVLRERSGPLLEPHVHRALRRGVDPAAPELPSFHLPRLSGRRPYEVTVRAPISGAGPAASASMRHAALYVRDPDAGVPIDERALRERFQLTPAEARTALALTSGGTLSEHSELLKLRPMTIRGYIKQIFSKTETHSQLDVVRLILTGAASMVIGRGPDPTKGE